jgi:hypothetical protein
MLTLVPCQHYWLEVRTHNGTVTALCKFYKCRQRGTFTMEEWAALAEAGQALNKPVRV